MNKSKWKVAAEQSVEADAYINYDQGCNPKGQSQTLKY